MKRLLFIFLLLFTLFPQVSFARTPKLLNLFLDVKLTSKDVSQLLRWDVVVLDLDQQWRNPQLMRELKKQNPSIKLLAYISASEIAQARYSQDKSSPGYQLAAGIDSRWFIRKADGIRAQWWPGAYLIDPTNAAPKSSNGQRWNTYLPNFIKTKVMSTGLWDGVFLDGAYGYVTAFYGTQLDLNRDKKADQASVADQRFFEGMVTLIQNVRVAIGDDKLIMNNSGERYSWLVNGVLFENVPQYGWTLPFNLAREMALNNQNPKLTSINSNTQNREEPYDYQSMRLGLAMALIADSYFSFDAGDANHHRTWWYDEYAADLGEPAGEPVLLQSVSSTSVETQVWGREYSQGYVIANPTDKVVEVTLPQIYQRLNGIQDPIVNNSQSGKMFKIWPKDGLVLEKAK